MIGPHVIFTGANFHFRSGSGTTDDNGALTGWGNVVVGYNEVLARPLPGQRLGSHNVIIGRQHRASSFGGLVAGFGNTISGSEATVSGGQNHTASGPLSSVSGGLNRSAVKLNDWAAGSLFEDF